MTYYIPDINAAAGYITKEVAPDGTIDYFGRRLDKAGIIEKYGAVLDFLPKRPTGFSGGMVDVIRKVFSIQEKTSYIEKIWRECDQVFIKFRNVPDITDSTNWYVTVQELTFYGADVLDHWPGQFTYDGIQCQLPLIMPNHSGTKVLCKEVPSGQKLVIEELEDGTVKLARGSKHTHDLYSEVLSDAGWRLYAIGKHTFYLKGDKLMIHSIHGGNSLFGAVYSAATSVSTKCMTVDPTNLHKFEVQLKELDGAQYKIYFVDDKAVSKKKYHNALTKSEKEISVAMIRSFTPDIFSRLLTDGLVTDADLGRLTAGKHVYAQYSCPAYIKSIAPFLLSTTITISKDDI